jgi:shikimate kinase
MASGSGSPRGYRRVLLVGFMGSGKSTVGALLASRLGWSFVDFDQEIERRAGASVEEIFREKGEPSFRALEDEVGRELLRQERVVLATGGGWPAAPGRMEALPSDTLSVWLVIDVETAVRRARGNGRVRPLLEVPDPAARAARLLLEREPRYALAGVRLDASQLPPEDLVERVLEHMSAPRREAGR